MIEINKTRELSKMLRVWAEYLHQSDNNEVFLHAWVEEIKTDLKKFEDRYLIIECIE